MTLPTKWFSNKFFIAPGLCDSPIQELFCRGKNTLVSFILNEQQFTTWVSFSRRHNSVTTEYRLVRDFNFILLEMKFILLYDVSQSVLLRCTQTDTFVNNRNKFSNLSAFVAQMS